jgi:LSD1 subclass zinc finger protein
MFTEPMPTQTTTKVKAPEFNLLQFEDKNDLKENLLPKDEEYQQNFKNTEFNYEVPKMTFSINSINDFEDVKNSSYVESKQNQLDFVPQIEQPVEKKMVSNNFVVQNESCSFCSKHQLQQQSQMTSVNYGFNGFVNNQTNQSQKSPRSFHNNNGYVPQTSTMNYNVNRQGQNHSSYTPNTINYSFQPNSQVSQVNNNSRNNYSNTSNNNINNSQQQKTFNYVQVPQQQQQQTGNVNINAQQSQQSPQQTGNNVNVVSYSFSRPSTAPIKTPVKTAPIKQNSINYVPTTNNNLNNSMTSTSTTNKPNLSQIDCSKCKTKLAYPQGCSGVFCPICQNVTPILKMDYIICGKCKCLLTFPSGAQYVKCQACSIVNLNPNYLKK